MDHDRRNDHTPAPPCAIGFMTVAVSPSNGQPHYGVEEPEATADPA
jgi:hypothetical protein